MKPPGIATQVTAEMAERCAGHHGERFQKPFQRMLLAMGQEQADADQEQEGRGDAAGVDLPAAEGGQARIGVAEEFEIPGEMVARHGEQRDAARDVDGDDAPGGTWRGGGRLGDDHGFSGFFGPPNA